MRGGGGRRRCSNGAKRCGSVRDFGREVSDAAQAQATSRASKDIARTTRGALQCVAIRIAQYTLTRFGDFLGLPKLPFL